VLSALRVDDAAPWKQRFRAVSIQAIQLAKANPTHGLVLSNQSGVLQLYAWDVPSGNLTQLTNQPEGKVHGRLSPDGRYLYYLDDQSGNETGHWVRVPFEGGPPLDLTPDLAPYSSNGSRRGTLARSPKSNSALRTRSERSALLIAS